MAKKRGFGRRSQSTPFICPESNVRFQRNVAEKKLALLMPSRDILVLSIIDLSIARKILDDGQTPEYI